MILRGLNPRPAVGGSVTPPIVPLLPLYYRRSVDPTAGSGKLVDEETALKVATAYRAVNIISDDIAKLPLVMYRQNGDQVVEVQPDARKRNIPYLLSICPNVWGWTPFQFKKVWAQWLILYGNSYIWRHT